MDSQKEDCAVCWDFIEEFEDPSVDELIKLFNASVALSALSNPLFLAEVFSAEARVVFWRRNVCCEQRMDGDSSRLEAKQAINQRDYINKKVQSFSASITPRSKSLELDQLYSHLLHQKLISSVQIDSRLKLLGEIA